MLATILPAFDTSLPVTTAQVFWSEFLGTAVLLLLGAGVVATNLLPKSKGKGGGWLMINFGWGLAVFAGVYVAFRTGGHLNPAVTIAKVVAYLFDPSTTLNGVPADKAGAVLVTGSNVAVYIIAQFLGAFVGAVLCWLTFKKHFDEDCDPALKLGVFSTGPDRDLGPRIAHAILPIKGKGGSDWAYSWVPVVAPIVGAVLGTVLYFLVLV